MSIHNVTVDKGLYFITFTCFDWIHLFDLANAYFLVYDWFDILAGKGHFVNGYVIMPNHIHALLYYAGGGQSLNTIVGNGKRFLAYDIVKILEELDQFRILKRLELGVLGKDRSRKKKHELWEESFDCKHCRTEKFILQKLNYIHNNPCAGKWKLASCPSEYQHSSARYYQTGEQGLYPVRHYKEFFKV